MTQTTRRVGLRLTKLPSLALVARSVLAHLRVPLRRLLLLLLVPVIKMMMTMMLMLMLLQLRVEVRRSAAVTSVCLVLRSLTSCPLHTCHTNC